MCKSMSFSLSIQIFIFFLVSCDCHREKRYLHFPAGTNFVVTLAMSTFLPKDIVPMNFPTGFAHIVEYDFLYPFPDRMSLHRPKAKVPPRGNFQWPPGDFKGGQEYYLPFPDKRIWNWKRRPPRALDQVVTFIDKFNYNGDSCLRRLGCEAHQHLTFGESLLEDFILAISPKPISLDSCNLEQHCPISILQILMHSESINDITF